MVTVGGILPTLPSLRVVFGQRLRAARESRGVSQEELARLAGFDRTYVSKIERGQRNITVGTIERLAEALGVRPVELLVGRK
jgi:transcriptional regulator with XRE-family HTH domain